MKELVNLIVKKTGISAATAQTIVKIVVDYIKKKLPTPISAQIDVVLSNDATVKKVENMLGSLASKVGTKKK